MTGNPGKRALKRDTPIAPRGPLHCPAHFNAEQQAMWHRAIETAPPGLLKPMHEHTLAAYIENRWIAIQSLRELGQNAVKQLDGKLQYMAEVTDRGKTKSPHLAAYEKACQNMRALASELGFTPSSAEHLSREEEPGLFDPWDKFEPAEESKIPATESKPQ